ncbi:MAG: hypothetical protein ABGX36_06715 [Cycloclasticus sp.]
MKTINTCTIVIFCSLFFTSASALAERRHADSHDSERRTTSSYHQDKHQQQHTAVLHGKNVHSYQHKQRSHGKKHWKKHHYQGRSNKHYSSHYYQPKRYSYNHYQPRHSNYYYAKQRINHTLRHLSYYNPGLNLHFRF